MILSDRIPDSRHTIETKWTMADAAEAHLALDLAEDLAILTDRRLAPEPHTR